jgi:O-antigen/teichoic acid export membrane protein
MKKYLTAVSGSKLSQDIMWTVGSFAVLAASGIFINIVVAFFRGAEALGIFNQAYSIYIVVSQIAAFGVHYSVLRNAAYYEDDRDELGRILFSGLIPAILLGFAFAGATFLAEPAFANLLSEPTGEAIAFAALGLALFPATKVVISFLNGLREMKAFATFQAFRYIIVAVVVTAVAASDLPFVYSTLCFVIAELATIVGAVAYILARRLTGKWQATRSWLVTHFTFGGKSLMAGMLGEVNTRVDVLCLGLFLDDAAVGIYSFAAMLIDGLYHLLAMVRVNFNPVLVGAVRDKAWPQAQMLLRQARRYAPLGMGVLSTGVCVFYWIVTAYLVPERGLQAGLPSLLILLGSLTLVSAYIPFDNMLLVGGYPGFQTLQQFVSVAANALINIALIPLLGIEGAAIGTAFSYIASVLVLTFLVDRFFGWNLFLNRHQVR